MGLGGEKQGVKRWYDGFTFGRHPDIYNPWSIASFISESGTYRTYWSNTSGNGLVNSLIQAGSADLKKTMDELLQGKSFRTEIDEQIVFSQLNGNADAVWSLLLATGYLRVLGTEGADEDEETLEDTLVNAHAQIEEKRYEVELIAEGFASEQIRKYGFAFQGKRCLIG